MQAKNKNKNRGIVEQRSERERETRDRVIVLREESAFFHEREREGKAESKRRRNGKRALADVESGSLAGKLKDAHRFLANEGFSLISRTTGQQVIWTQEGDGSESERSGSPA